MTVADLVIRGGTVVTARGRAELDVYVRDGRIAAMTAPGADLAAERTVDARGRYVLPGMVDTHVHLMDPGDASREDFPTGTEAAARRGVTTIIEHTHAWPVTSVARLEEKLDHLVGRSWVDYGLAAHAWTGGLDDVVPLWRAGISFFKVFTCETHGVPATRADAMLDLFEVTSAHGIPCLVHCEDDLITARNERRLKAVGRVDNDVIRDWRSRDAEEVAAATVAVLARTTDAKVTIAHASTVPVMELLAGARRIGADIAVETCPQYLFLREQELTDHGPLRKFTPPARIRDDAEEAAMWQALRGGLVSHLSTDHAPSTLGQKADGDIWSCHFGLPGLDTTLPMMVDAALTGRIDLEQVVQLYAEAPAAQYGLAGKGRLAVGVDADLVVIDPTASTVIADDRVVSRAGWTPYAGHIAQGGVATTVLRGEVLVDDGELVAHERSGRFLAGPGAAGGASA
jgi:allantoinase